MRYSEDDTLLLEPEHEELVLDEENVDLSVGSIRIKLNQRIHSDQNPFITYWEVEYLSMTPNHNVGETRVMTENMISNNVVPEVETKIESGSIEEEEPDSILAEPEKKVEEPDEQ